METNQSGLNRRNFISNTLLAIGGAGAAFPAGRAWKL